MYKVMLSHKTLRINVLLALLLYFTQIANCISPDAVSDYTRYVNVFVGTGGHGHTFPGATTPHGMIQPSPDTRNNGWDACSGYHYTDSLINGFSQTHLSGTGCTSYGDILIMPITGKVNFDPQAENLQNRPFASLFSHDEEVATPGFYAVNLKSYNIKAQVTASPRAAFYKFTYPETSEAGMVIDLDFSIGNQYNIEMDYEFHGDTALTVHKTTYGWAYRNRTWVYFHFSKPFKAESFRDTIIYGEKRIFPRCKLTLDFGSMKAGDVIDVKGGISHVDSEGAKNNLYVELSGKSFDQIKEDAKKLWNDYLSKIQVSTSNLEDKQKFYTSLYHTAISPNLFIDSDMRYRSISGGICRAKTGKPEYTVYSLWDTHRALHPLLTIIDPELNNRFLNSLLTKYEEGGVLPMWELCGNYTGLMPGYHAVSPIADAVTKGIADFDIQMAYRAACKSSACDTSGIKAPDFLRRVLMLKSKDYKNKLGFIPWDSENESVAKGLEYAYDDWCVSLLAKAAGDKAGEEKYKSMGQYYRNYSDPETRFMRGKGEDGKWHEPFNPYSSMHRNDDYCEGTAWQWSWFVPHDVEGLMELLGGKEAFAERLDSLFTAPEIIEGEDSSPDIAGFIGQYAHGNEPSHHIIHLYNYADQPWKTQELVDKVLKEQYRLEPDGLSGNEDCGQMSAWYVLNAMGFYQVCAGKPVYSIGRPVFDEVIIPLANGKSFRIKTVNNGPENKFVKDIKINGKRLKKPFFNHSDILDGATLEITMSKTPAAKH